MEEWLLLLYLLICSVVVPLYESVFMNQQILSVHRLRQHRSLSVYIGLHFYFISRTLYCYAVTQLVEALRYKPEGRGFDFRWCHLNFSLT